MHNISCQHSNGANFRQKKEHCRILFTLKCNVDLEFYVICLCHSQNDALLENVLFFSFFNFIFKFTLIRIDRNNESMSNSFDIMYIETGQLSTVFPQRSSVCVSILRKATHLELFIPHFFNHKVFKN